MVMEEESMGQFLSCVGHCLTCHESCPTQHLLSKEPLHEVVQYSGLSTNLDDRHAYMS